MPTTGEQRGSAVRLTHVAVALVVAIAQFRVLLLILGPRYRLSVEAAQGVLAGEPHWRVYQNRLLGPWIVRAVEPLAGSFERAHVVVSIALLALAGWLVLHFLTRLHPEPGRALAGYFLHVFLTVACFGRDWLYVWDLGDLVVFVLFNAFVAIRAGTGSFAALFAVALFQRESALFIAAWMVLDPVLRWLFDREGFDREGRIRAAVGCAILLAGIAIVEALRSALLVREVGPSIVGAVAGAGPRVHFMLPDNLRGLVTALTSFRYTMSFLVPCALVAFLVFAVRVALRDPKGSAIAVVHAVIVVALLLFGVLFETRVYLVLVPFVAFWLWPRTP